MMKIVIKNIYVDEVSINPKLVYFVELHHYTQNVTIISVSGNIKNNKGKVLASIDESILNDEIRRNYSEVQLEKELSLYLNLSSYLTPRALEEIEKERNQTTDKSVKFQFEFAIKYFEINNQDNYTFCKVNTNTDTSIEQSKWIREFAGKLDIGKFLLLEMQLPENIQFDEFWADKLIPSLETLSKMNEALLKGEWEQVLIQARKFSETIKIGDGKKGNDKFKIEFERIMKDNLHNDTSVQNFYDGIWQFFEYFSKFLHHIDNQGYPKQIPLAQKEDAYFAYSLCLSLINLISNKISRNTN